MACRLAENIPLQQLRAALELPATCHSLRDDCLHSLTRGQAGSALGAPGSVIGYCQALFRRQGRPSEHTQRVAGLLERISAPWHLSHELAWSQLTDGEVPIDFFDDGVKPLADRGRVPIFITPLRVAKDWAVIRNLISHTPASVDPNEPVLLRVLVSDQDDVDALAQWVIEAVDRARRAKQMPRWWPLAQSSLDASGWASMRQKVGAAWEYINIAVNPFTDMNCIDDIESQITVAQLPVGGMNDIGEDGFIGLPTDMKIFGSGATRGYDLSQYAETVERLDAAPTLIVLGPSLPDWTDEYNSARLGRFLPHLRTASERIWNGVSKTVRDQVWSMAA